MNEEKIEYARKQYEDSLVLPEWDRKEIHGIDFEKGAQWALSNQWISVEEDLPKESGYYLVIARESSDSEAYFHEISTYNATDNIWHYIGKLVVTHWMEIPSLKGGKR